MSKIINLYAAHTKSNAEQTIQSFIQKVIEEYPSKKEDFHLLFHYTGTLPLNIPIFTEEEYPRVYFPSNKSEKALRDYVEKCSPNKINVLSVCHASLLETLEALGEISKTVPLKVNLFIDEGDLIAKGIRDVKIVEIQKKYPGIVERKYLQTASKTKYLAELSEAEEQSPFDPCSPRKVGRLACDIPKSMTDKAGRTVPIKVIKIIPEKSCRATLRDGKTALIRNALRMIEETPVPVLYEHWEKNYEGKGLCNCDKEECKKLRKDIEGFEGAPCFQVFLQSDLYKEERKEAVQSSPFLHKILCKVSSQHEANYSTRTLRTEISDKWIMDVVTANTQNRELIKIHFKKEGSKHAVIVYPMVFDRGQDFPTLNGFLLVTTEELNEVDWQQIQGRLSRHFEDKKYGWLYVVFDNDPEQLVPFYNYDGALDMIEKLRGRISPTLETGGGRNSGGGASKKGHYEESGFELSRDHLEFNEAQQSQRAKYIKELQERREQKEKQESRVLQEKVENAFYDLTPEQRILIQKEMSHDSTYKNQ